MRALAAAVGSREARTSDSAATQSLTASRRSGRGRRWHGSSYTLPVERSIGSKTMYL